MGAGATQLHPMGKCVNPAMGFKQGIKIQQTWAG